MSDDPKVENLDNLKASINDADDNPGSNTVNERALALPDLGDNTVTTEMVNNILRQGSKPAYIKKLNEKHALLRINGSVLVLNEGVDADGNFELTFSKTSDFKKFYANQLTQVWEQGKLKKVDIATLWLKHKDRRDYKGLCFKPGRKTPDGFYNLYRGLAFEPKKGSCRRLKRHVLENLCNGDSELYEYIMNYLAHIVQNLGQDRPGVSIVLLGKQGTGKGILLKYFGSLFGCHYLHVADGGKVTGRFNSHLMNKIVVFLDEGVWGGDKSAEGVLKSYITEPTIAVEAKGQDIIQVDNNMYMLIASNNEWVIPAGLEERRFCVLKVSDKHMQDHEYFAAINDEMKNGGREALLYELLNRDISDVNLREVPRTDALLSQIQYSLHGAQKFWLEAITHGYIPLTHSFIVNFGNHEDEKNWDAPHSKDYVYQAYVAYVFQLGERYPANKTLFLKKVREVCPSFKAGRQPSGDRMPVYIFPDIDDCRREFEQAVNISIPWDEENQSVRVTV